MIDQLGQRGGPAVDGGDRVGRRRGAAGDGGRAAAAERLLGAGQVARLEDDPPVGRGDRQVGQRGAGRRVIEDDRPRVVVVFLGAEEGGQRDEIGPDDSGPIDV